MYWQGWIEMGHIFCWKCGSVNFLLLYIWKTWAHLSWKSNRIIVRRTRAQNTWRGAMQGERMLDKISIVHWMSLPNTPILCTTSVTNCRILSQEMCLGGSQYYKCSLFVNGWRHTVSLTSQMDCARLFDTLWSPCRKCWLLDKYDKWRAPIFQYKLCATNHFLVNMNAFARGQNPHWHTH